MLRLAGVGHRASFKQEETKRQRETYTGKRITLYVTILFISYRDACCNSNSSSSSSKRMSWCLMTCFFFWASPPVGFLPLAVFGVGGRISSRLLLPFPCCCCCCCCCCGCSCCNTWLLACFPGCCCTSSGLRRAETHRASPGPASRAPQGPKRDSSLDAAFHLCLLCFSIASHHRRSNTCSSNSNSSSSNQAARQQQKRQGQQRRQRLYSSTRRK